MRTRHSFTVTVLGLLVCAAVAVLSTTGSSQTETPDKNAAQVERGRYLVTVGGCSDCHTPKIMTEHGPVLDSSLLLAGYVDRGALPAAPGDLSPQGWAVAGNGDFTAWTGDWGVSFAANLTSDKKTGLGQWTAEQFIKAMRTGKHRGFGRPIMPPMPWFNLAPAKDEDLAAMLAFFQSTRPIDNKVPDPIPPAGK